MDSRENIQKILTVSYHDDYIDHLNDELYLAELLKSAKNIIESGGKVILEIRYINAAPDIVKVFSTIAELNEWENKIKEMKERRKKGNI